MTTEHIDPADAMSGSIGRSAEAAERLDPHGRYWFECRDAAGNLKWREPIENLITTVGKNDLWDKYLAGATYTAAWFLGLISSSGYSAISAADTAASHSGWTEFTGYSNANRPAPSWTAATGGAKASTATLFTINAAGTVKGGFLISNSTKGGTTGVLFSVGLFSGGDRGVADGDTLNVTYTASA